MEAEKLPKLSVSAASLFKACPRKFFHQEICGWEPAVRPPWLTAGSAYDRLLEFYDLGGLQKAVESIPELFPDPYAQVDAKFVLAHYQAKFGDDPMPPIPGGNQYGFGIPFYGNEVTGPVAFKISGYMDKVCQDGNTVTLVERKTTSESIEEGSPYFAKLPLDAQIRAYCYALLHEGRNAGKVVYEVIRKPSTTLNRVFDKKCSLDEYVEKLARHQEKKTVVARRTIFITRDMCDDWITSHALVWKQIQACKKHQAEIEALGYEPEYAWTKHEGSCAAFGGCFMRDCCEGLTTPEAGPYCKSEKWKKANGGTK